MIDEFNDMENDIQMDLQGGADFVYFGCDDMMLVSFDCLGMGSRYLVFYSPRTRSSNESPTAS